MNKENKLLLPKTFTESTWQWMGKPEEFKQFIGMPCISYSQIESFKNYYYGFIKSYLLGIRKSTIWIDFGSEVGKMFEHSGNVDMSDFKVVPEDTLDILKPYFFDNTHEFEKPIYFTVDVEGEEVLFYGFIDVYKENKRLIDIKTANPSKFNQKFGKKSGYMQTKLYCYGLDNMGIYVPKEVGVFAIPRKGNNDRWGPIRVEGEPKYIETPYKREEVEEYIEYDIIPTIMKISNINKIYKTYFDEQ
jgi:hypothetical protein